MTLKEMLERQEGRRNKMYLDSEGIPTIGIGHNLRDRPLSDRVIDAIYEDDLLDHTLDAQKLQVFVKLDPVRQDVLINMVFNMGLVRVQGFVKMLAALEAGDWNEAANQMLDSKWAMQVGNRAQELAKMIRTGTYP